jgi:carbonic anhydrase
MCERCTLSNRTRSHSNQGLSRRTVLAGATAALAMSGLLPPPARADQLASFSLPPNAISPHAALQRLKAGNARYVDNAPALKDYAAGRAARASAQYPFAAVLGCADSRVAPELAFDQGPGEVFTVRVAGNFVNPDGLASLEYAVEFLGVPLLFVLGHSKCGAVDAAIKVLKKGTKLPGHLPELVRSIKPAVLAAQKRKPQDLLEAAIEENVRLNMHRLADESSLLKKAVASGKIAVAGGVYDLATGKIRILEA